MSAQEREARLRAGLAKRIGVKQIDDADWAFFVAIGGIDPFHDDEKNLESLERLYGLDKRRSQSQRTRSAHQKTYPTDRSTLETYELQRQEAFDLGLGNVLATLKPVVDLRARLELERWNDVQITELLDSDAARECPPEFFQEFDIPMLDHQAFRERIDRVGTNDLLYSVFVDPPGGKLLYLLSDVADTFEQDTRFVVDPGTGDLETFVVGSSVLGLVAKTGSWLAGECLWTEGQCNWFLLSGEIPNRDVVAIYVEPHASSLHLYREQRIVMDAPAWVSRATVEAAFGRVQRDVLGGDRHKISARNLGVFVFVETFAEFVRGRRTPWQVLVKRWNAQAPEDWAYRGTRASLPEKQFLRDYGRARELIQRSGGKEWQGMPGNPKDEEQLQLRRSSTES